MKTQDIKILIVEDEPLVAKDIQIKLQTFGYRVLGIVDTALDATDHAARYLPDLVLMDIVLPGGMDGIQAANAIRQHHDIPVIYLTAYSDQVFLDRAKITDPMAYIIKPASNRDLHAAICIALQKAENEKQQQEKESLAATLIGLADALLVWNRQGQIIRVNKALLNLMQCEEQALMGHDVTEAITLNNTADGNNITEKLICLLESQGELKDDRSLFLQYNKNKQITVRVSGSQILNKKKQCLGHALLIRDDTERKQQEQLILESEARFRQLANHIESIFYLGDIQKKQVIYLSPAYEKIYGRLSSDIKSTNSTPFLNHVYPDDQNKVDGLIHSLHEQKKITTTFRINRPNGEIRWVAARCYPVLDAEEATSRMACLIDDVTEQTKAEIKLQQAATVFENTAEGILITDTELNIIAINKAFTMITGYTENDVIGKTPSLLRSGRQAKSFYKSMWHAINTTGHWQGEIVNRRKNGETYPQWMTINTIHDPDDNVMNYISIFSDITHIKESQQQLDYLAHHDHLTGFANRLLFNARLEHAIERAMRDQQQVAVVLMDLDRFKEINDNLGHGAGDELLKILAGRLKASLREEDTLARLGGDEFIFILEELHQREEVLLIAEKINQLFVEPFLIDGQEIIMTASLGISLYPNDGKDVATLIKRADMAMYNAKQQGKNRIVFFKEALNIDNMNRLTMATEMRLGLDRGEFMVHYQPQVRLDNKQIIGAEALVRWKHPEKGGISPLDFIPLAEETGFIEELGEWVLFTACQQCKKWHEQGYKSMLITVNLSARQFLFNNIVETVKSVLNKTDFPAQYLELEITESGLMDRADKVVASLDALKSLGVSLSIDDFGTGYSSLSYLKRFPIDKLKIDRTFVKDLPDDEQDASISRSIIALGKSMNLTLIAEGIETELQREFMINEGCDQMQGFLFSEPISANKFTELLHLE